MCGIFGIIGTNVSWSHTERLAKQAERRGQLMVAKTCLDSMVDLTSVKK